MEFKTLVTLKLRVYQSVDDLRGDIKSSGAQIPSWADKLLGSTDFELSKSEEEIDLVAVYCHDLDRNFVAACRFASEHGLRECPPDTGPQLIVNYSDQPEGEELFVITKLITDPDVHEVVDLFCVVHDVDGRHLNRFYGSYMSFRNGENKLVFCRRQKVV